MEKELTIQQVSELTGVSTDTLRYYERLGLLQEVGRDASGHRARPGTGARQAARRRRVSPDSLESPVTWASAPTSWSSPRPPFAECLQFDPCQLWVSEI